MTLTRRNPPDQAEARVGESAASRFAGWAMHAPAERVPQAAAVPVWVLALVVHVAAHLGHFTREAVAVTAVAAAVGALAAGWAGERKGSREARAASQADRDPHPHVTGIERAIATAVIGAWLMAAVAAGPLGGPHHVLAWSYLAGTLGGYWWLRRHPAVLGARGRRDQAATREMQRAEWRSLAALVGLTGSFLHDTRPNNIGLTWVIDTHGTTQLASQINCRAVAERLAGELSHRRAYPALTGRLDSGWIPKGRVEARADDKWADRLIIMIRNSDPWAHPVLHPMLDDDSPYAAYTPVPASICNPIAIGTEPETGAIFPVLAWSPAGGGQQIAVLGSPEAGKSTLFANVSAGIGACPDAAMLQINITKPQTDAIWAPISAATSTGDPDSAIAILAFASAVIALRSDPARGTSHPDYDMHQPTATAPAYFVKIDEAGSLGAVPGSAALVQHIAQAGRSEAVSIMLALHRSTANYFGNANIRALVKTVIAGSKVPAAEVRRLLEDDADVELPDMRGYGEGQPGVFMIASRFGGQRAQGRTFFLTKDLRNWRKMATDLAAARDPFVLDPYLTDLAPGWETLQAGDYREAIAQFARAVPILPALLTGSGYDKLTPSRRSQAGPQAPQQPAAHDPRRAKIDAALATLGDARPPEPVTHAPVFAPQASMGQRSANLPTRQLQDRLRAMLARPEGVTSRPAAAELRTTHTAVQYQLRKWRDEGTARWDGQSNTWREARPSTRSVPYLRPVPDAPDDDAEDAPGNAPEAGPGAPGPASGAPGGVPGAGQSVAHGAPGDAPGHVPADVPGHAPGGKILTGEVTPGDKFTPEELALIAASWLLLHGLEDGLTIAREAGMPEEIIARATELLDTDRPYVEAELRRWRETSGGGPR